MNLKFIEIDLVRPQDLSVLNLRHWVLAELREFGEPLRWAITYANSLQLKVEAVVIISNT